MRGGQGGASTVLLFSRMVGMGSSYTRNEQYNCKRSYGLSTLYSTGCSQCGSMGRAWHAASERTDMCGVAGVPGRWRYLERGRGALIIAVSLSQTPWWLLLFSCLSRSLFNFYPIYLHLFIHAPSSFLGHLTLIALQAFFQANPQLAAKPPPSPRSSRRELDVSILSPHSDTHQEHPLQVRMNFTIMRGRLV